MNADFSGEAVSFPLSLNADITLYAKMKNVTQISEGLGESLGLDLKSMLAGFIGGKIAGNKNDKKDSGKE